MPFKSEIDRKEYQQGYSRSHYLNNKELYAARAKAARKKLRVEIRAFITELKKQPCTDCKMHYPSCVMDFDHLKDKRFNISQLGKCTSMSVLRQEVAKCEIVCANCHRIRTSARLAE